MDGKIRACFMNTASSLTNPREASAIYPLDMKLRIMETREDTVVEEIVALTGKNSSAARDCGGA